ncbi:alcohol oxidase-like protein [Artomyces pyxidatus]|uniref:Alcohol oxidase-like protein n=1 Tax=Artomyces pyxidatus TaxID=48021 RepID=A0ACB8TDC2_9AGAM|nr:alcohol oxidase-like protein [Artomyces pyxidatus]
MSSIWTSPALQDLIHSPFTPFNKTISSMPNIVAEYDIILAGGGTAAGVIAGRLAAAAPSLRILVLEAGPSTRKKPEHTHPGLFAYHFNPSLNTMRFHVSKASAAVGGRAIVVQCGQCVGGGSSVNFTMYTRASKSDYDDWETEFGNVGWGSEDLLPLLKKTETYQIQPNAPTHGYEGPLKVSYGGAYINVGKECLAAAQAFDTDRGVVHDDPDSNDLTSMNIYQRWPKWIDAEKGTRSDVPHHFLYPQESNTNLTIVTGVHVRRVIFNADNQASGVEFVWNPQLLPDADRDVHTVMASRLVVISAGTFGSPGILERSGIGHSEVLKKVGVEMLVDLPGVGKGYQDHNCVFAAYKTTEEAETHDFVVQGDTSAFSLASEQWATTGKGLLAHNAVEFGAKLRPTDAELELLGPAFREYWDSFYAGKLDKPVIFVVLSSLMMGDPSTFPPGKYFSMGGLNTHPLARGYVHVTEKDDVAAPIDFSAGYLESMADVTPIIWIYKHTREIARRMPLFRGEYAPSHPRFPPDSPASVLENATGPIPVESSRIVYSEDDDAIIERFVRDKVQTTWHSLGTCAMKPREDGGVVDSSLNVYGVKGLKIADMSICPGNVSANTYSTALVVAEKAVLIIADELGIIGA